jgi:hypothetical protein
METAILAMFVILATGIVATNFVVWLQDCAEFIRIENENAGLM